MSKLVRVGRLYTTKQAQPAANYANARKACSRLKSKKTGRLTKWRMARVSEINKFKNSGVKRLKYWGRASSSSGTTAPAIILSSGKESEESRSSPKPRPFCVSTR